MQTPADLLDKFLSRPSNSVCPIFKEERGRISQLGSGVFIRIGSEVFLLTAAHVTDEQDSGVLRIPGIDTMIHPSGYHSSMRIPESGERADDRYDIAYFRLMPEIVADLHPETIIFDAADCDTRDTTADGDTYTMIGYPARKSSVKGITASSELFDLTGAGRGEKHYAELGLTIQHHILISHRKKKCVDFGTERRVTPPNPEGMSGGGVFAWAKDLLDPEHLDTPKLCGIIIEHYPGKSLYVATRLDCFINCILMNNPDLPVNRNPPMSRSRER